MAYNRKKRPTPKGKFREEDRSKVKFKEKANDPEWYIRTGQLAKDVASLSFNNALGARCVLNGDNAGGNLTFTAANQNIPGVMAIYTVPAVTPSYDESSAINLAAKNLYTFVRHQNSGHSNYESADMMMYIMAMDSAYSFSAWMTRLYGILKVYSQVNRYIGTTLLRVNGVNDDNLIASIADFRAYINIFNTKLSAFCTPNTMSLFKRHWWMYSNMFSDNDVAKSQMYMYCPAYLWKWVENSGGPAYLDTIDVTLEWATSGWTRRSNSKLTLANIKTIGDAIIGALVSSEDINIMSGDILKAYGRENVWSIGLIGEDYSVVPIYSEEILDQIHNTTFTGANPGTPNSDSSGVTPNKDVMRLIQETSTNLSDYIAFKPSFIDHRNLGIERVLDMSDNEPTPERVLVATRNMVHGYVSVYGTNKYVSVIDCAASDMCMYATIFYYNSQGALNAQDMYDFDYQTNLSNPIAAVYTKFRKAPLIYPFSSSSNHTILPVIGDIENFTVVDASDLIKMHESAMLSMLGVPV